MDDRLRSIWNFDDLDAGERRFGEQLALEDTDEGRAEVLTQLARVAGLRGDFDHGDRLLDEAESRSPSDVVRARVDLERGRLRRSGGDPTASFPLFETAFTIALDVGQDFIAADAAHMAALAAPDRAGFIAWTQRGIDLADARDGASYWLGPLLNNLGWEYFETADFVLALDAFQRALVARERTPENAEPIALARYAVGKSLRALGRADEAIPHVEAAVAWATGAGTPDGWFHEELAEEYAAVGRLNDASEQARLAIPLLEAADSSFSGDQERKARLTSLS